MSFTILCVFTVLSYIVGLVVGIKAANDKNCPEWIKKHRK